MADRLRGALAGRASAAGSSPVDGESAVPGWATRLIEAEQSEIARALADNPAAVFAMSYEPRPDCFFDGDDPLDLMRRLPRLVALNVEPRAPWPPLAELDPYTCNLRIEAIAAGTARRADARCSDWCPIRSASSTFPAAVHWRRWPPNLATMAISFAAVIDEQRQILRAATASKGLPGRIAAAARVSRQRAASRETAGSDRRN